MGQDTWFDSVVTHLIHEVLGHRLPDTVLKRFEEHGLMTILELLELKPQDLDNIKFLPAEKNLWFNFINFMRLEAEVAGLDLYEASGDFFLSLTGESFKTFRKEELKSQPPTSNFGGFRSQNITSPTIEPRITAKPTFVSSDQTAFTPMPRNVTHRTLLNQQGRNSSMGMTNSPTSNRTVQTINPIVKKSQKITDYPVFSGQKADWKLFERKFLAVANSQNYGHVLDLDKPFMPTLEQEEEFQADLKYIYQASDSRYGLTTSASNMSMTVMQSPSSHYYVSIMN